MYVKKVLASFLIFGLYSSLFAEKPIHIKAIVTVDLKYDAASFSKTLKKTGPKTPLVLENKDDALNYFTEKQLESIAKQINFKTQKLVVIVWKGSGRDEISYKVLESFPEQIKFTYKHGRTKDLRPHLKLFALRKNVKI
jgi:hypothetical protein